MTLTDCLICNRIALWREGRNSYFIEELKHSIFVVGDHQFHRGYCLVLLKDHVSELLDLSPKVRIEVFEEVMLAAEAIVDTFHPWKMNYSCYGNAEPHVHWHLFPRYEDDPDRCRNPWRHSMDFNDHRIDTESARELAALVRTSMRNPH